MDNIDNIMDSNLSGNVLVSSRLLNMGSYTEYTYIVCKDVHIAGFRPGGGISSNGRALA